jgi:hypothetical protein
VCYIKRVYLNFPSSKSILTLSVEIPANSGRSAGETLLSPEILFLILKLFFSKQAKPRDVLFYLLRYLFPICILTSWMLRFQLSGLSIGYSDKFSLILADLLYIFIYHSAVLKAICHFYSDPINVGLLYFGVHMRFLLCM